MRKTWFQILLIPFLLFYAFQVEAAKKEERNWNDEVIYFIMIDRFHNGDTSNDKNVNIHDPYAYHGGDFKGITQKLDYLKGLGATAIWLTPIFDNEKKGYHGYWTKDFYNVDEHFGTLDEFKELVQEAHNRDMKVILDLVVNHTGYQHDWLYEADKEDWFHEKKDIFNWESQTEIENGWLFGLPDLNHENEEVTTYLLEMAKWWITETNIDGYRLDTVKHVPKTFWKAFSEAVTSVKEDFFLIGEVWHDDPRYVAEYNKTGIESFVDYPYYNEISTIFSKANTSLDGLFRVWKRNVYYYEEPYILGNFIDNHDNVRFVRKAIQNGEDPETRLKLALTYLFSAPGIPIIYQGTEFAMDGGNDPDNRRMMDFTVETSIADYVKQLTTIREKYRSLRDGDFEMILEKQGMALFKRTFAGETTIIAINNTTSEQTVVIGEEQLPVEMELKGLLKDEFVRASNGEFEMTFAPEEANIYVLQERTNTTNVYLYLIFPLIGLLGIVFYKVRKKKVI